MTTEAALQTASALLPAWARGTRVPEPGRLDILINAADLLAAVQTLLDARWGTLVAITGLDLLGKEAQLAQDPRWLDLQSPPGPLEVLYHFSDGPAIVTLRVLLPRQAAEIDSVCGLIPSASFFERELSEMFGIAVVNTPDPAHLFLPEDWPDGVHPLRKDFVPNKA